MAGPRRGAWSSCRTRMPRGRMRRRRARLATQGSTRQRPARMRCLHRPRGDLGMRSRTTPWMRPSTRRGRAGRGRHRCGHAGVVRGCERVRDGGVLDWADRRRGLRHVYLGPDQCQSGPCSASRDPVGVAQGAVHRLLSRGWRDPTGSQRVFATVRALRPRRLREHDWGCRVEMPEADGLRHGEGARPRRAGGRRFESVEDRRVYIHVVAEAAAKCTTGQRWSLTLYP